MADLNHVWEVQKNYNRNIFVEKHDDDPARWTKDYLLGMVSEMDEILREIDWKEHRKEEHSVVDKTNMAYELADMTKYILSLWQVWGFSVEDMIRFVSVKSEFLEQKKTQEWAPITEKRIMIVDLDGTIADWRASLNQWIRTTKGVGLELDDPAHSLMMDSDLSIEYPEYHNWKNEFEQSGEYSNIKIYPGTYEFLKKMHRNGQRIIYYTARPNNKYHRIWFDTMQWIHENSLPDGWLYFGSTERILLAKKLMFERKDRFVILFDDDFELITRAYKCGIHVYVRRHNYNSGIDSPLVTYFDTYEELGEYL